MTHMTLATHRSTTPASSAKAPSDRANASISLVNLAARQRMLSQRMILLTLLAAKGDLNKRDEARRTLQIFSESQAQLLATPRHLAPADAARIREVYEGRLKIGMVVAEFVQIMTSALEQIDRADPNVSHTIIQLIGYTDRILEGLNTATTVFDEIFKAKSEAMLKELAGIVGDIQSVAKEAKVVSFNAQIMAARAGQHGREFAVVANVLTDITGEIDLLTRKAVVLASQNKLAA
jgi:methyl-accepting chemotaxis protein